MSPSLLDCRTGPHRVTRWAALGVVLLLTLAPAVAFGAPTGGGAPMPWTGPLQSLLDNLTGPTARILGALAFVVGGLRHGEQRFDAGRARTISAMLIVVVAAMVLPGVAATW